MWGKGWITKGHGTIGGMTIDPCLDRCGSHITVNACQNSHNCTPKRVNLTASKLRLNFKNGGWGVSMNDACIHLFKKYLLIPYYIPDTLFFNPHLRTFFKLLFKRGRKRERWGGREGERDKQADRQTLIGYLLVTHCDWGLNQPPGCVL